jgi:hypothetical protein
MMLFRSNPGRPTIKESQRRFTFSIELCAIPMISNPDCHVTPSVDVELELAMLRMPLNLEASITPRHESRSHNVVERV